MPSAQLPDHPKGTHSPYRCSRDRAPNEGRERIGYNVIDGLNPITTVHFGAGDRSRTSGPIDIVAGPMIKGWRGLADVQLLAEDTK